METRKINWLMVILSLIGGALGAVIGEIVLSKLGSKVPDSILIGIYFGVISLFIAIACFISELLNPALNGYAWRSSYAGVTLRYLILTSLIFTFVISALLQLIYGLNLVPSKKINDVVMLIDVSGSMGESDPSNERFSAAKELIDSMENNKRAAVLAFNNELAVVQPMAYIDSNLKQELDGKLRNYTVPTGGTDIKKALDETVKHIKDRAESGRNPMVILLTDGLDDTYAGSVIDTSIAPFKEMKIPVYTVGLYGADDYLLKRISKETRGDYFSIKEASNLKGLFNRIYSAREQRLLVDQRNGIMEYSIVYAILRVLFIMIISFCICLGLGLMFDNKNIAKSFSFGGILSGFVAGLILEVGFNTMPWRAVTLRMAAVCVMALIFTLIPVLVRINGGSSFISKKRNAAAPVNFEQDMNNKMFQ